MKKRLICMLISSVTLLMAACTVDGGLMSSSNRVLEFSSELTGFSPELKIEATLTPIPKKYTYSNVQMEGYITSVLCVRDMPEDTGAILGIIGKDKKVLVTGQCNETKWYRIEFDGGIAYVDNSRVEVGNPTPEKPETKYTFNEFIKEMYAESSVNVRDLPTVDGKKVGCLDEGEQVEVTGQCNETNWYRIVYGGKTAYVSGNYLVDKKLVVTTTPTTKPKATVTPKVTTSPSVEMINFNFYLLKNAIEMHGNTDDNGNKFISHLNNENLAAIIYHEEEDIFEFDIYQITSNTIEIVISFELREDMSDNIKISGIGRLIREGVTFSSETTLNRRIYNGENLKFTVIESSHEVVDLEEYMQDLLNMTLQSGMIDYDTELLPEYSMTLADLGFSSFDFSLIDFITYWDGIYD